MCGISGILRFDGDIDLSALERANAAQQHRGPDDEGYLVGLTSHDRYVACVGRDSDARLALPPIGRLAGERFNLGLAFRRLAIVDLSIGGHQPMSRPDGSAWIVFNGEIYNYLELRDELAGHGHVFHSGSDTEVILAAYAQWGVDCTSHFNGMWAFVIFDTRNRSLFASRDRFGEKPLHYTYAPGKHFAFASEMKALWAMGAVDRRIHEATLERYRRFGETDTGEQTFYKDILRLPQGHSLLVTADGQLRTWRYWELEPGDANAGKPDDWCINEFRELFIDSVRLRMRSDVPVGSSLSGGLDSSTVVCVMNKLLPPQAVQKTFSARFADASLDEGKWMGQVVSATGVDAQAVYPDGQQFFGELPSLFWHQEEPFGSSSIYAQWCVMRLAKDHGVTVLLDGQGADETLAGYHTYFDDVAYDHLRAGDVGKYLSWRRTCREMHRRNVGSLGPFVKQAMPAGVKRTVKAMLGRPQTSENGASAPSFPREFRRVSALRKKLWWHTTRHGLNELLRFADRNSMAHSREVRLPFLDHRLVEFVFTLRDDVVLRNGWTKWILRQSFPDMVPAPIRDRLDKVAYRTPEQDWLRGRVWQDVMIDELTRVGSPTVPPTGEPRPPDNRDASDARFESSMRRESAASHGLS